MAPHILCRHSNSPTRESSHLPPRGAASNNNASSARVRAIDAGRSVCRNTAAPSPTSIAPVTFGDPPQPFQVGGETPSITTPYTEDERSPFRRPDTTTVVYVPKLPTLRQLCNWNTRVGHGLTAASSHSDPAEYGWIFHINTASFDEFGGCDQEPRCGLLAAPLLMALYKT